jgi:putative SOS response-associated peptidase YedK
VTSFNEGREITPTKTEQHVLTPLDGKPVAIAVVWKRWSERDGPALLAFAMVTAPPNALIGTITDRMPALIEADDWAKWLGEVPASPEELKALLRTSERGLNMRKAAKPAPKPKPGQPGLFLGSIAGLRVSLLYTARSVSGTPRQKTANALGGPA